MSYGDYLIDPYVHTGEDISGDMFNTYVAGDERRTLFMNYGKELEEIRVRVRSLTKPVICDTLSGEVREVSDFTVDGEDWLFDLTLPNTHGIVVVAGM